MPLPVFTPPDNALLRMPVPEVPLEEIASEEIQSIIDQMYSIAKGEREDLENRVMVGLAAPQIGIAKCIILVDLGVEADRKNLGELKAFINPKIVWASEEKIEGREGCYSVDRRVLGIVHRAARIKVIAYDRHGNYLSEEFSGFTARIFQHEIDHLQGIRFPDRVGEEGVLQLVEEEEYNEYRKDWQNWPVRCPWTTWLEMKGT